MSQWLADLLGMPCLSCSARSSRTPVTFNLSGNADRTTQATQRRRT